MQTGTGEFTSNCNQGRVQGLDQGGGIVMYPLRSDNERETGDIERYNDRESMKEERS